MAKVRYGPLNLQHCFYVFWKAEKPAWGNKRTKQLSEKMVEKDDEVELIQSQRHPSERRAYLRKECSIPLSGIGKIKDIGLGGLFLEADDLPKDRDIPLTFNLSQDQVIVADAKVVNERNTPRKGYGLKFTSIDVVSRLNILNYLAERTDHSSAEEDIRNSLEPFLKSWPTTYRSVEPEFKQVVADFRLYLSQLKNTLDKEEKKLFSLASNGKENAFQYIIDFYEKELQQKIHSMLLSISDVIKNFTENEHASHRVYFRELMLEFTDDSIFCNRARTKPLGYAGDYMMMEILYHGLRAGKTLWQKVINSGLTSIPLGQAVRNRAWFLAEKISGLLDSHNSPNVMSLACGPCEEIAIILEKNRPSANYYLVDQDKEALQHAKNKLLNIQFKTKSLSSFNFRNDLVKKFLKDPNIVNEYPKMDLIYAAGLYDYLNAPVAERLTQVLLNLLKPGGQLIIGNFTRGDFSFFIEYASDWFLIYRTPEELLSLIANQALVGSKRVEIESSGVNLFLCVTAKS